MVHTYRAHNITFTVSIIDIFNFKEESIVSGNLTINHRLFNSKNMIVLNPTHNTTTGFDFHAYSLFWSMNDRKSTYPEVRETCNEGITYSDLKRLTLEIGSQTLRKYLPKGCRK